MRQDDDQRVLAKEGRLAPHVRAGEDLYPALVIVHEQIVRYKAFGPVFLCKRLEHDVSAPADQERIVFGDLRAGIAKFAGEESKTGQDIALCHDGRRLSNACRLSRNPEPNLLEQLPDLVPLIGVVQVSDWRAPPRSRHDRVLPGDGIIPLAPILETLIGAGYQRHFDLQVWSDELWQGDYLQLLRRGRQQFESLLPRLPSAVNPLG